MKVTYTEIADHSPGPWRFEHGKKDKDALLIFNHTGKWALANCSWPAGVERDECVANARLVAAGPELLEACKAIVECSQYWANAFSGERRALDMARKAIVKATLPEVPGQ